MHLLLSVGLFFQFYIKSINTLHVQNQKICFCEELYLKEDCVNTGCRWDPDPELCFDYTCSDYTIMASCDSRMDCAWDQKTKKCSTFSQCAAYQVEIPHQCYFKGSNLMGCVPTSTENNGLYKCDDYLSPVETYVKCEDFITQDQCDGFELDGKTCEWHLKDLKCKPFDLNSCSDATNYQDSVCNVTFCILEKGECREKKCSDITNQFGCTIIPLLNGNEYIICDWVNGLCISLVSAEQLSASDCMKRTLGTYTWNSVQKACLECKGAGSVILRLMFAWMICIFI